ncbi:MAG TPA: secretin N-terminal domain-containing protein, partial [Planctomycetaceae bacterium]|nr:secretin N-terminal domain-containing protein [Planctomycetaceae bacterium]
MNRTRAGRIGRLVAAVAVLGLTATSLVAQPPGGGRGGPGGFGGFGRGGFGDPTSVGTYLRRGDIQSELGLSDELREQIGGLRPDFTAMMDVGRRLRDATDEEERERLQAEMREIQQRQDAETEDAVRRLLSPEQMTSLLGIVYREAGPRALTRPEIVEQLNISEQQRDEIRRLVDERNAAFGEQQIFRASDEDRQKFDEEWNTKLTAVLTPDQQQQWQGKAALAGGSASPAPANAVSPIVAAGTGAARAALTDRPGSVVRTAEGTASDLVVASFDAPRGEAAAGDDRYDPTMLSFNFQNALWADVLDLFAKKAGFTLDALDVPPGTFTYKDTTSYTPLKALDVLHGYLLQRGHVMVYRDKFMVVLNIDNRPIPPNLVPRITLSELDRLHAQGIQNQLVQVVLPLDPALDAEQVATQIEGLLGPQRHVIGVKAANQLAVRDTVSDLVNLREILERMSVPPTDDVVFRAFPLKHILASEAEPQVRKLFGLDSATPNVSSAVTRGGFDPRRFGGGFGGGFPQFGGDRGRDGRDSRDSRTPAPAQPTTTPVQVTSDRRTNSLLVAATAPQLAAIEEVLRSIDVPIDGERENLLANNTPVFRVYKVTSAEADEVARTLTALMPAVVINDDDRRGYGYVHIMATPLEHQKVAEYIRMMDGDTVGGQSLSVIRLSRQYHPTSVAALLNQMFATEQAPPTIQGEVTTWSLLIKGSAEQIIMARKMASDLGLEGSGNGSGSTLAG